MNTNDLDISAQTEAERAEREQSATRGDPRVDRYRLIVRALRQPLTQQLPDDFAARVAAAAELRERGDGFEDWLIVALLLVMGIGGLLFIGPTLANIAHAMVSISLPPLPWNQLVMAALCIGIVWAIDTGWTRMHRGSRRF
jgi:hypothetical protein